MNRAFALYRKYGLAGTVRRMQKKLRAVLPAKTREQIQGAFVAGLVPSGGKAHRIGFTPEVPTINYLITGVCKLLNATPEPFNGKLSDYDAVFLWEDKTIITRPNPELLNGRCKSIGKERVAAAFERVFGLSFSVDPERFVGAAVMKSDENGMHDGKIVQCPTEPVPGYVFQKVVDNIVGKSVEDLRVSVVGNEVALVVRNRRYAYERFANTNHDVTIMPIDTLSRDEQFKLVELARDLGLDMCDFDVLRDGGDGHIYVVDAAKTPFGPPLALSHEGRTSVVKTLAAAFHRQFLSAQVASPRRKVAAR